VASRWLALCALAACGRINFDARGIDGSGSGIGGDGPGGDSGSGISGQQAYVKASNTDSNDEFGFAIALSGDGSTMAVGAYGEASTATGVGGNQAINTAQFAGAVYVFTRSGTTWTQQAYIKASNTQASDMFGMAVALSNDGSVLAVGAPMEASASTGINGNQANNGAMSAGAVYLFERVGAAWSQSAYVKASNTNANDSFGGAIALSGDGATLAVGATGESSAATGINGNQADNTATNSGAVYVFAHAVGTWTQQAYIKASNAEALDEFGLSVALSDDGSALAVGAPGEASRATGVGGNQADNSASDAGAVYVFSRASNVWKQQAYVKASNTDTNDTFGIAVALSGDGKTLAVGARHEASKATGINGDQTSDAAMDAGAAYLFSYGAAWAQTAYVKASNTDAGDILGDTLALSGDGTRFAVGAWGEASNATGLDGDQTNNSMSGAGAVYSFSRSSVAGWSQIHYVKASNTQAFAQFGSHLALSRDGRILAVGAPIESSNGRGIDGNQSDTSAAAAGAVYVFQ
jgi:hypothetical protein